MKNLTNIKDRILFFIDNQGIKISKFYTESGVSYGILTQKSKITEDNIVKFLTKYPQVNSEWLLTGNGEMLKENKQTIGNIEKSSVVGANVNGSGININSNQSELIDIIKKQQDQIGQLIDVISKLKEI